MKAEAIDRFLESSEYIDWKTHTVKAKANALATGLKTDEEIAKACFEFVRDRIKHSWDYQLNPVTLRASEALKHATGYCYAKSHLLAALLRANNIPAALCYQRLTLENDQPPFCLHGLNSVYLKKHGWLRIDPRGNKEGVDAKFNPPNEILAFEIKTKGEKNIPGLFPEPLDAVVDLLKTHSDFKSVAENLPDI